MEEKEIDLRGYVEVIIQRWKMVLAVMLLAFIVAGVVYLRTPRVYEVTLGIRNGVVAGEKVIPDIEATEIFYGNDFLKAVIAQVGAEKIFGRRIKPDTAILRLKKIIALEFSNTVALNIRVRHTAVAVAKAIAEAAAERYVVIGNERYEEKKILFKERFTDIETQVASVKNNIATTEAMIESIGTSKGISDEKASIEIILLQNIHPSYQTQLAVLLEKLNHLKLGMTNSREFKIINLPLEPERPISAAKKESFFIALNMGLLLGILLAFFLEYWEKGKIT